MRRFSRVHVVGAGLAGLAASVRLAAAGLDVALYEAAPQAGGRCRSYQDALLGCRIDNGNHLLLAGNAAAMDYVAAIGARETLTGPEAAAFPFLDLASGERWVLRPGMGRLPWWLFAKSRRVPGTRIGEYLASVRLARARPDRTVAEVLDRGGMLYRRFWQPLAVAALNTQAEEGQAKLLACVVAETFAKGATTCRPLVPREGLSESLVDPALVRLGRAGATIRFGTRLRAITFDEARATALDFDGDTRILDTDEAVVLAVPAAVAPRLVPGLVAPQQFRAIVNAHYLRTLGDEAPLFVGLVGGTAEWVFRKRAVLSVTVSAADRLLDEATDVLALRLWREVERAFGLTPRPMPPVQIVKERRATFAATPAECARRPVQRTRWPNLALAGDWTATGLPATIEGAIRSGHDAAAILLA